MPKVHNPTDKAIVVGPFVLQVNETGLFIPDIAVAMKMQGAVIEKPAPKVPEVVEVAPIVEEVPIEQPPMVEPEPVKIKRKYTRRAKKED